METEIIQIKGDCEEPAAESKLRQAGSIIKEGGLVAFPTETVYGLGGDAFNPESSRKIYAAKGRPSDNPLIIHIYRFQDIYEIVEEVPEEALKIADAFWPGPLTMILHKSKRVPYETTGGLDTVAVRFPSHPIARKLIEYGGGYIAAPSANASGRPSPTKAGYVVEDMNGRIDAIVDGGPCGVGVESTIIDLTSPVPRLLRPGGLPLEALRETLGEVEVDKAVLAPLRAGEKPKAPGMKYRHYAPKAPVTVVTGESRCTARYIRRHRGEHTGVICFDEYKSEFPGCVVESIGSSQDKAEQARRVFDALRAFDETDVNAIYAQCPSDAGLGLAVANRLKKAAGFQIVDAGEAEL